MGKKYKADADNKYEIIYNKGGVLYAMTVQEFINDFIADDPETTYKSNNDDDNKVYYDETGKLNAKEDHKLVTGYDMENFWVVNTSGALVKSKSKCKDGDDIIVKVEDFHPVQIYEELD